MDMNRFELHHALPSLSSLFYTLPVFILQISFYHFPVDVPGKLFYEFHHFGDLHPCKTLFPAEAENIVGGGLFARSQLDDGGRNLSQLAVRITDHAHIQHHGVPHDGGFDLQGENVDAAADDHLLETSSQVQKSILVHVALKPIIEPPLPLYFFEGGVQLFRRTGILEADRREAPGHDAPLGAGRAPTETFLVKNL